MVAAGFGEARRTGWVKGLTSPWGWNIGLKGGYRGGDFVGFFVFTWTVMVPDSFGPPAMALGRTRGYVT